MRHLPRALNVACLIQRCGCRRGGKYGQPALPHTSLGWSLPPPWCRLCPLRLQRPPCGSYRYASTVNPARRSRWIVLERPVVDAHVRPTLYAVQRLEPRPMIVLAVVVNQARRLHGVIVGSSSLGRAVAPPSTHSRAPGTIRLTRSPDGASLSNQPSLHTAENALRGRSTPVARRSRRRACARDIGARTLGAKDQSSEVMGCRMARGSEMLGPPRAVGSPVDAEAWPGADWRPTASLRAPTSGA